MAKLILIEGIPGSGKSSTAKKIEILLKEQGFKVFCFQEGDLHPCDLAWHACVPMPEYKDLIEKYQEQSEILNRYTSLSDTYACVAYTKLELEPEHPLFIKLKTFEPYGSHVSLDEFKSLHFSRWEYFGKTVHGDVIYIFECAYLQNHVTELMLNYQQNGAYIKNYMQDLLKTVQNLRPYLIYLSPEDVDWTIRNVANERKSGGWQWIDE